MENKEFKKRETKSTYSINGRNFQINSYDPMVGNYILMQIVSQVMPMGLGRMLNQQKESILFRTPDSACFQAP